MTCGIYKIRHLSSGKSYIGQAKDIEFRIGRHRHQLNKGSHYNYLLQFAWKKHGELSFVFEKVLICESKDLTMYEQVVMDFYKSYDPKLGYNLSKKADSPTSVIKHGGYRTREYKRWQTIKRYCYNPSLTEYKTIGAKGITVCDRWKNSFANFLEDMGKIPEGHFLRRINKSKNYEPDNCDWWPLDKIKYQKSKQPSLVVIDGVSMTCSEAAKKLNVNPKAVHTRAKEHKQSYQAAVNDFLKRKPLGEPGQKYNRLTLIKEVEKKQKGIQRWLFKCDCGNDFECGLTYVKRGNTRSCGCALSDFSRAHIKRINEKRKIEKCQKNLTL